MTTKGQPIQPAFNTIGLPMGGSPSFHTEAGPEPVHPTPHRRAGDPGIQTLSFSKSNSVEPRGIGSEEFRAPGAE